mgnify:CR=1 FL=1
MREPDERIAKVGDVELAYEELGDSDGEPLLLVMGLATQMIGWPEGFCEKLGERGYRVIRYDNRDIGHSTKLEDAGRPGRAAMLFGTGEPAYLLEDLADDAAGLLDFLGIESAHVVGASMGGMIAQTLAIRHPEKVRSLASIMSGPGSRWSRMPRLRALGTLMQSAPSEREAFVDHAVKTFSVIGSPGFERDEARLRETAALSYDRSFHPPGVARQLHAITASPSRTRDLREVKAPTVVIHGRNDPLVRLAAGRATARAVPGARFVVIDGMGHDLPEGAWDWIVDEVEANGRRAAKPEAAAAPAAA